MSSSGLVSSYISAKARKGEPSGIAGRGLVAVADIARDEIVAIKGGHIVDTATLGGLPERLQNSEIQIADGFHLVALDAAEYEPVMLFLNHSCEPNVGFAGNIVLVAMRDIAAGEELTTDYALFDDHEGQMACRCGRASCRGVIDGRDWQRPELKRRYDGYFSWYLQRLPSLVLPPALPAFGDVLLRPIEDRDADMVMDASTDPYVPQIGTLPGNASLAEALAYIRRQHERLGTRAGYPFCIADRNTDEALGQAGLWLANIAAGRATAGYVVAPRSRGRRVASQALAALTRFGWTLPDLWRIELYIEPWNTASQRTAEFAGYEREGLLRSHQQIGGRRVDMLLYAATRPES